MSELLGYVPVLASATLGLIFLATGHGTPVTRTVGVVLFLVAAYLQFWSRYLLQGILLQVGLAMTLEFWRRSRVY